MNNRPLNYGLGPDGTVSVLELAKNGDLVLPYKSLLTKDSLLPVTLPQNPFLANKDLQKEVLFLKNQIALDKQLLETQNSVIVDIRKNSCLLTEQLEKVTEQNRLITEQLEKVTEQNRLVTEQNRLVTEQLEKANNRLLK